LKNAYSPPKIGFFGGFLPTEWEMVTTAPPKGTSAKSRMVFYPSATDSPR